VDLAKKIGKFIFLEEKMLFPEDKIMAYVLVEFDVTKGLPTEVEICCLESGILCSSWII